MIKLLLGFGIWGIVFVAAMLGLITTGPGNPRFTGTIVHDFKVITHALFRTEVQADTV
jgi:hypothetical protein